MIARLFSRLGFLVLGLAFALTLPAGATVIEHEGWLFGEEANKAIELAQEHNVPVAVMRTYRDTTCPKCVGAARRMANSKSTSKMVRVMVYVGGSDDLKSASASKLVNKAYGQTKDPSNWIPDLYFMMPDGRALGFVPYEDAAQTETQAKAVVQIAEWLKDVEKTLEKADKDADKGRYESALKSIDKIMDQDAKISHLVQLQLRQIDKKAKQPETPANPFFAGLKAEKLAEYQAIAMEQIAKAKKLIEKEELREAQRLLRTLARTPEGFEAKTAAEKLMDEVNEKLKAS